MIAERAPDLEVEGEMHADAALSRPILDRIFPDADLTAEANLLIMPNLDAANITFNALKVVAGQGISVGPILLGAAKPVHILTPDDHRARHRQHDGAHRRRRRGITGSKHRGGSHGEHRSGTDRCGSDEPEKPWYKLLYVQVLIAIVLGVLFGWLSPEYAKSDWVKAMGDGFIKLIKMVIAPIIFCTIVSGISHIQDAKKVGRVGLKALVYFEVVSTFALIIGLIVGNVVRPGAGFAGGAADAAAVADLRQEGRRTEAGRLHPAYHPRQRGRRLCAGRHPAGAAVRHPVRLLAAGPWRAWRHDPQLHR